MGFSGKTQDNFLRIYGKTQFNVKKQSICVKSNKKYGGKEMEQKPREKPEIVVPTGYKLEDIVDTDDNGYGFKQEAIYTGEVSVKVE